MVGPKGLMLSAVWSRWWRWLLQGASYSSL